MKEIVFVVVLELSLDLRIGCEFWSLWIAVWRCEMFGALEERRASTAMLVPPGTTWHQLYSVPPTGPETELGFEVEGGKYNFLEMDKYNFS